MVKKFFAVLTTIVIILSVAAPAAAAETSKKPITPPELKNLTFIHYAKPDKPGKPPKETPEPEPEGSYKLTGLYLPGTATYYINSQNAPAEAENEIFNAFEAWDAKVTSTELFNNSYEPTNAAGLNRDGQNTVSWVKVAPPKIIAVTSMWYEDDGDPATLNKIVEFDIAFNTFLEWGIDTDGEGSDDFLYGAYDVRNIGTHEVGHVVGLADLYDDNNSELTMYGYGRTGETIKISLADGDIEGANLIYN
jgi:hypothetical protein